MNNPVMGAPSRAKVRGLLALSASAIAMSAGLLAAPAAFAQTEAAATTATADTTVDAVIVTTERREQSLQDVAATVQTFSGEDLRRLGVNTDIRNLQIVTPGLQITKQEGKFEVFLRGIGSTDSDFSSDPSVATHYNGVYLPRPRSIGPMFFDTQRVEVNKGPQGTIRGRNATGGTINIISNQPVLGEFGGYVSGQVGNYKERMIETALNVPVGETVAVRGALYTESHDSYLKNAYGNGVKAPGDQDDVAGRLTVLWKPTDNFTVNVMGWASKTRGSGEPGAFSGRSIAKGYDINDLDDPWKQYFRTTGQEDNDLKGAMATLRYDLNDKMAVEYLGSFNKMEFYNRNASREWQLGLAYPGSEAEAYYTANTGNANPARLNWKDTFYQAEHSKSQTHELRLFSTDEGKLQWSAGAFLFKEDFSYASWDIGNGYFGDSDWFAPGTVSGWQNGLGGENRGDGSSVKSYAGYADGTFALNDNFRIKGGLRYTQDKKHANESNAQYQFVFNKSFLAQYGLTSASQISIGNNGFRLKDPGARSLHDPLVCTGNNRAELMCEGSAPTDAQLAANLDYFFDGVQSFGAGDNWDDFFKACKAANQCYAVIKSDFPTGVRNEKYKSHFTDWRLGFEYDVNPDFLVYGTISTGHRAGGLNRPITLSNGNVLAQSWDPEKLMVYELGAKNTVDLFGNRTRFAASAFFYDYKDKVIQNLVSVPTPRPDAPNATANYVFSDNSADARLWGAELDGDMRLPAKFTLGFNLSYTDSDIRNSSVYDDRSGLQVSVDGHELPLVSKFNANLRLGQTFDVNWGAVSKVDWTINMMARSSYYLTVFNSVGYAKNASGQIVEVPLSQLTPSLNDALTPSGGTVNGNFFKDKVDGFAQFNANVGANFGDDGRYRIDGYVTNITETAFSGKGFINNSVNIRFLNPPRTYGVRIRASF